MELLKLAQGLADILGRGTVRDLETDMLQALHIILHGDFPERKRHYSALLFRSLLDEFRP